MAFRFSFCSNPAEDVYKRQQRKKHYEKGERKKRTHRLCNLGGMVESVAPEVKDLTRTEMTEPVSYTHLDVYKRQSQPNPMDDSMFEKSIAMLHNWVMLEAIREDHPKERIGMVSLPGAGGELLTEAGSRDIFEDVYDLSLIHI